MFHTTCLLNDGDLRLELLLQRQDPRKRCNYWYPICTKKAT